MESERLSRDSPMQAVARIVHSVNGLASDPPPLRLYVVMDDCGFENSQLEAALRRIADGTHTRTVEEARGVAYSALGMYGRKIMLPTAAQQALDNAPVVVTLEEEEEFRKAVQACAKRTAKKEAYRRKAKKTPA